MRNLISGIHRFRREHWSANKDLFERLADHGQKPEALFITCCDSRVDPTVIIHGRPGDLFILKNIGNFVPPYSENPLDGTGVAAAVEYAVHHLHVRDIIVCGHSDCGAMKALSRDRSHYADTPHIAEWLRNGDGTLRVLAANYSHLSRHEQMVILPLENILLQVENLRTYPVVRQAVREGRLHVHAWFYVIRTGEVHAYDPLREQFEAIRLEHHEHHAHEEERELT